VTAPWYATREQVQRALDVKETARSNAQIDRALDSASRSVEGLTHRRFYPQQATRYFDWPNGQYARPWRLWLDDNELISVTTLTTGGTTISASDFFLRRSDNKDEAPYSLLELDLDSNAAFGGSATAQRDIAILGLYGHGNNETSTGTLAAAVSTTTATTVTVDGPASAALGVGSLLRVDNERMIVTSRTQVTTGQTLQVALTDQMKDVTVQVTTGSAYAADEMLLLDSERMLIIDVAGNALTVQRKWDGSTLAAHTAPTIYAARTLTVQRGALGTTAATHSNAAPVYRWDPPGPVNALAIAEAMEQLLQEQAGYGRVPKATGGRSSGAGASPLDALRDRVYDSHGRKGRVRAV
jgi:hypothetical protein